MSKLVKYRDISNVNQNDKNTNSQILLLLGHQPEQASDIQTCAKRTRRKLYNSRINPELRAADYLFHLGYENKMN